MTFYLTKEALEVLNNGPTEDEIGYLIESGGLSDEFIDELFAQMDDYILNSKEELTLIEIIENILKELNMFSI